MLARYPLNVARAFLVGSLVAGAASASVQAADQKHHALSLVGDVRFPAGFKHFDWVNPDAPKGGVVRLWTLGGFDSLNAFSIKGRPAAGLATIYDSLMASSPDEPSAEYCLVCEWVSYAEDFSSATFHLRENARFHDGKPARAFAICAAHSTCFISGCGSPNAMLLRMVLSNRWFSCSTKPIWRRRSR